MPCNLHVSIVSSQMVQYVVFDIDWEWYSDVASLILQFLVVPYLCIAYTYNNLEFVCDAFIYYFASPLQINEFLQYHCWIQHKVLGYKPQWHHISQKNIPRTYIYIYMGFKVLKQVFLITASKTLKKLKLVQSLYNKIFIRIHLAFFNHVFLFQFMAFVFLFLCAICWQ